MQPRPFDPTDYLNHLLPVGSSVLVMVAQVNAEGTSRQMRVIVTDDNGAPLEVTGLVAVALERRQGKSGIIVRGGGMDMRRHLLEHLSRHLHNDERALKLV